MPQNLPRVNKSCLASFIGEFGTHIVGGGIRYLQAGSSLALECVVTHTRAPPSAVFWYRDNNVLDYDSPRGGISLQVGQLLGTRGFVTFFIFFINVSAVMFVSIVSWKESRRDGYGEGYCLL